MAILLATLRPSGIIGDQDDGTFDAVNDGGASGPTILLGTWLALSDWDGSGTVEFLRFFSRSSHTHEDQGPADPFAGPAWRIGAGPVYAFEQELQMLDSVVYQAQSPDLTLTPDGQAWTLANVNALQMNLYATTDDQATQLFTQIERRELWAEVWGAASGEPLPKVRASGVVDKFSGSGILSSKVSASGVVNKFRGRGTIRIGG